MPVTSPPVVTIKNSSGHCQMSPEVGRGWGKPLLVEKQCSKPCFSPDLTTLSLLEWESRILFRANTQYMLLAWRGKQNWGRAGAGVGARTTFPAGFSQNHSSALSLPPFQMLSTFHFELSILVTGYSQWEPASFPRMWRDGPRTG